MLNNLVNRHDVGRVFRKVADGDRRAVLDKLKGSSQQRVVRQWSDTAPPPSQWWAVPAVRRRWNKMVSGDEECDFPAYVADRYLRDRPGLKALSLGCGMGGRELRWAELDVFDQIDAFDIAPSQVEVASARAVAEGYGGKVSFEVRDFTELGADHKYDVVLAEHSLHHLAPMPDVVAKIDELLQPGGLFVVDEYVGPQRFQWTGRQLAAANEVLDQLPDRYRRLGGSDVKERVVRPSRLWMILTDPSEAIDSARIVPTLHERFEIMEELPYGGSVLHLALADIAQNFLEDDAQTEEVLRTAFATEDELLAAGVVTSDFVAFVCRKRVGARS